MKKQLTLMGLGLVSFLSANQYQGQQYYQGNQAQGYYQGQPAQNQYNNSGYYQSQGGYQNQPRDGYNQGQGARYQVDVQQANSEGRSDDRNTSDNEVDKTIHDTLAPGMFSSGYPNVNFRVNNGNVLLSGSVDTIDDKNKVEDKIRKIKGVRQVSSQINVKSKQNGSNDTSSESDAKVREAEKNYPQDTGSSDLDKRLNARIRARISDGWFTRKYEAIVLRTNNGVVTIFGAVDSNDDIKKITDQLKDVDGVRAVNNQLSVKNK